MKTFIYEGRKTVFLSHLIEYSGMPRSTMIAFILNKELKTAGKIGYRIVIACDDLQDFLNSKAYKNYILMHPGLEEMVIPAGDTKKITRKYAPANFFDTVPFQPKSVVPDVFHANGKVKVRLTIDFEFPHIPGYGEDSTYLSVAKLLQFFMVKE